MPCTPARCSTPHPPPPPGGPAWGRIPGPARPGPSLPPNGPSYGGQNLLSQLQPDTLPPPAALAKPALAPNFLPAQLATPESFKEPIKPAAYSALPPAPIQMVPLKAGPAVSRAEPSVLLSPSVFQHSVTKTPELDRKPAPPSPSSLAGTEPPSPFNRLQLQDTLIHLIKNDSSFLNAIHEAYLQSLSKDLNNMKL
ncbi:hypothetical protein ANANG_G00224200 [Anguilla anguilla]|uniref:mRNA-decapping enzyme C-terminal domain-containing protein n=1 Tax=Anguilla anguilla TaxID=7936 RepID=A0A9D3LWX3_ANGAN|nr:hypothetical protein ANANG_G00224200 [Anguilla anguilla]